MSERIVQNGLPGEILARERRAHGLSARDVADGMGVCRSRVTAIEALAKVREATARRYLDSLVLRLRLRSEGRLAEAPAAVRSWRLDPDRSEGSAPR